MEARPLASPADALITERRVPGHPPDEERVRKRFPSIHRSTPRTPHPVFQGGACRPFSHPSPFALGRVGRSTLTGGVHARRMTSKKVDPMARGEDLRTCHRCGIDFSTGGGERSRWWDGTDLPLDLDVYCDTCRLHFFMCEADRPAIPPASAVTRWGRSPATRTCGKGSHTHSVVRSVRLLQDLAHDPIDHAQVTTQEVRGQEAVPDPHTGRMADRLGETEIRDER